MSKVPALISPNAAKPFPSWHAALHAPLPVVSALPGQAIASGDPGDALQPVINQSSVSVDLPPAVILNLHNGNNGNNGNNEGHMIFSGIDPDLFVALKTKYPDKDDDSIKLLSEKYTKKEMLNDSDYKQLLDVADLSMYKTQVGRRVNNGRIYEYITWIPIKTGGKRTRKHRRKSKKHRKTRHRR